VIDRSVRKTRKASTTALLSTFEGSVCAQARHLVFPSPTDGCTASVYETRWTKRVAATTMVAMATKHWPLFDLRIVSERLVLRPLADDDFDAMIEAIDAGIHDPDQSPFLYQWADEEPVQRARNALQFWWGRRASWMPTDWSLGFGVWLEGRLVGVQELEAKQFPILREVSTGSWLTQSVQGQGIGKEMRAAVLSFSFGSLGAEFARTAAFVDNAASLGVTRHIGYRENGRARHVNRGTAAETIRFTISRDEFEDRAFPTIRVENLEPCLPMFGL
jgi:RimJ/RimL family protein N-acetyltransferase